MELDPDEPFMREQLERFRKAKQEQTQDRGAKRDAKP
jgi:hypothetical protein